MSAMLTDPLPCGVRFDDLLDDLLDQVADGPAGMPVSPQLPRQLHQQSCPHCRAALDELGGVWAPVRALAAERVVTPNGLVGAVLRRIRTRGDAGWQATVANDRGVTRVSSAVIGEVARRAAADQPDVVLALGRCRPADDAGGTVVDVRISVPIGAPIPTVARRVRAAVRRQVQGLTGVRVQAVDVTVIDVVGPAQN
jgi:hypothetical protein